MTTRVEKSIQVDVPVNQAYNQWTQFEDFPHFMGGVREVRQLDDRHLHWVAEIAGVRREWDASPRLAVPEAPTRGASEPDSRCSRARLAGQGARRWTFQARVFGSASKRRRSCMRLVRPCQNSTCSAAIRHPPQCPGTGTSPSANRRVVATRASSMARRSRTTVDCADAHAPSCDPRGRVAQ